MKKEYIKPNFEIVKIETNARMLVTSNEEVNFNSSDTYDGEFD